MVDAKKDKKKAGQSSRANDVEIDAFLTCWYATEGNSFQDFCKAWDKVDLETKTISVDGYKTNANNIIGGIRNRVERYVFGTKFDENEQYPANKPAPVELGYAKWNDEKSKWEVKKRGLDSQSTALTGAVDLLKKRGKVEW
jgi:hypothetical protein